MLSKPEDKSGAASMKDAVVQAIRGCEDEFTAMVETLPGMMAQGFRKAGEKGSSLLDVVTEIAGNAAHGALEAGADIGHAAKGITVGILHGTRDAGDGALRTIAHTSGTVIRQLSWVGGDVERAARGLVQGAIHWARDLGLDTAAAASAAAQAAVEAAREIGADAARKVRIAATGTIDGVDVVLHEPQRHASRR